MRTHAKCIVIGHALAIMQVRRAVSNMHCVVKNDSIFLQKVVARSILMIHLLSAVIPAQAGIQ